MLESFMGKKIRAYISVEASHIFSFIIFLYYLIILVALLLMGRCLVEQNNYIICMRTSEFTNGANDYGEVLYGSISEFDRYDYLLNCFNSIRAMYVGFQQEIDAYIEEKDRIEFGTSAKTKIGMIESLVKCIRINPVMRVREMRD